jgi:hypothetical protein
MAKRAADSFRNLSGNAVGLQINLECCDLQPAKDSGGS